MEKMNIDQDSENHLLQEQMKNSMLKLNQDSCNFGETSSILT